MQDVNARFTCDMETPNHGNGSKITFEEFPFFL